MDKMKAEIQNELPTEDEISFVASDESNHHDWNDLRFKPVWVEGFEAGAKWMKGKRMTITPKPDDESGLIPKEIHLALETARLEIESLNKRCGYLDSGALIQIRDIFAKYKLNCCQKHLTRKERNI